MEVFRKINRLNQKCTVCKEPILKGDCISIVMGGHPGGSHKKCEPEMLALTLARREIVKEEKK